MSGIATNHMVTCVLLTLLCGMFDVAAHVAEIQWRCKN